MVSIRTQAAHELHSSGYKLTPQRRAVLAALDASGSQLNAAGLRAFCQRRGIRIGKATIYRTLKLLSEQGIVCPVRSGAESGYVPRPQGKHGHVICAGCGRVASFNAAQLSSLQKQLATETGFTIDRSHVELSGMCPDCREVR
jgi:Fur family ferric uptake transcriptional regulator